jgi:hypothetical protein
MRRSRLLLAVLFLAAPLFLLPAQPALACSCRADVQVKDALATSDAAFVGVLVGQDFLPAEVVHRPEGDLISGSQPVINHFEIERVVKGQIGGRVDVNASASGSSCGLELSVGDRAGLLLQVEGNSWRSSLCLKVAPGALLAFAPERPSMAAGATGISRGTLLAIAGVAIAGVPLSLLVGRALRRTGRD